MADRPAEAGPLGEEKLRGLEDPWEGDLQPLLAEAGIGSTPLDGALGTVGGGNHFAELQAIDEVKEPGELESLGLAPDRLVLLVHSGSRGLGEPVLDLYHNSITRNNHEGRPCWLHCKGAAPSDAGAVVTPGSRGTPSYLVRSEGDQQSNAFSVAHGAGRKWTRTDARARLERHYSTEDLRRTDLGGRVISDDKELLYEKAPQAYKNIDRVIEDLIQAGLIEVVATMRPLITYKMRAFDE